MTTIVHLASSGELGGAERVILDILAGLAVSRPEWTLHLVVPLDGPLARRASSLGIAVTVVPWSRRIARLGDSMSRHSSRRALFARVLMAAPGALRDILRMRQTLAGLRPSLVHAHGFKMQLLGMWTRPWRTPVVLHLHDYVASRAIMSRVLAARPPGSIAAIAISRSIRDDARHVLGPRMPIEVVHNGIDSVAWSSSGPRLDLDAASGLTAAPSGTVRVGLVATMARWKGHEIFLRALALLPPTLPVRGYVVGGSIYQTDSSQHSVDGLRSLASGLGLGNRVGFTGFIEEPANAMRALDVVVHASERPEPFGRVIIEGMSTMRAVIARDEGGAAELFEPDREAIACRSNDPAELARAVERLARDPALRATLGRLGRARVQRDFSRDHMTAGVARVYDGLLR